MNREIKTKFTASLHTHVRSLFDAEIDPNKLCERIKELGGKGCAITDHGVLSSIEDFKTVFADNDLKMIPGVELYVNGGILGRLHLVLLAKNDNGYKGICKIVTESNKTMENDFPVISKERLFELMDGYKGDIVAMSACIAGVICSIYLLNDKVEKKISSLRAKQAAYYAPDSNEKASSDAVLANCQFEYDERIRERDITKAKAEQKFTKREKAIEKLKANGQPYEEQEKDLLKDKAEAKIAVKNLDNCKKAVEDAKKSLSNAKKVNKEVNESIDKWDYYETQINVLKKELKTGDELDKLAESEIKLYLDAFGKDDFYAEVQNHGIKEEALCFPALANIAKKLGISVVATNDVHILTNSEDDVLKRCLLKTLRYGNQFMDVEAGDTELYLKDNYELFESLVKILPEAICVEAINNIDEIFEKCNVEFKIEKHYPKFSQTEDANKLLREAVVEGVKWRFPDGMSKEYRDRLEYEMGIIESMGYADYHLVVKDFLEYGRLMGYVPNDKIDEAPLTIPELKDYIAKNGWKNQGLTIGPGRGSAAGSLVCFCLGITNLDPIKYGLLFERFLNPERISMPDIDSDIANLIRPKVIEFVKNKYGEMAVCAIMTKQIEAPKGALRTCSKFYSLKKYNSEDKFSSLAGELSKSVPNDVGTSFKTLVDENGAVVSEDGKPLKDYLMSVYKDNKDAVEIIKWASILEGSMFAYSAHAAGIVISDNSDISDYIPLRWNDGIEMFTTQCDMVQVEDNGLLKFDFLGLKTLDILTGALRMIEQNHGIIIDPLKIDVEDPKVYAEIFALGKTNSVFQFESAGMKSMLKRFKPTSFEDLIILVSMFRPGPLQYLDGVIDVKNGRKEMTFLCPQLESILGKTYGAIVYQEQVMEICQKLAGYTLGGADTVRRYMSKKKKDKLAHERDKFVEGCAVNGIESDVANTLFDQMEAFARYAFNKSHAAVYAFTAYLTAWFKLYYPAEFFASALNWADKKPKIIGLMYEAQNFGVKVCAPSVNNPHKTFDVINGDIYFGLSSISGVKDQADGIIEYVTANGSFSDLKDFLLNLNVKINVINNLICSGAFDEFCTNREAIKRYVLETKEVLENIRKKASFIESAKYVLPYVEKSTAEELIKMQKDNGLSAVIKEPTTVEKLQSRIKNAATTRESLLKTLNSIHLAENCEEDKSARMALEKEYLGAYVTQHPMDFYPESEEVGCEVISELNEDSKTAYGIITNLTIKQRKRDGADMAFFTLEDKTSSIDVCVFVKEYEKNKDRIKEGNVVKLFGEVKIEEAISEEEEDILKFFTKTVEIQTEKSPSLLMKVSSYALFHVMHEQNFIQSFKDDKNGRKLYIYDSINDEIREATYKVSEKILNFGNVTELNI